MFDLWGRGKNENKSEVSSPFSDKDTALILSLIILLKGEKGTGKIILALMYILL